MEIYGQDFAAIYNQKWAFWGPKMWPFLYKKVKMLFPAARNWLDLCCGAGSLLKYICSHKFRATGVDISRYQLHYAGQNAPKARLLCQDIRKLSLPGKYDIISCMFDSLNYFTSKQDLSKVFKKVQRHMTQNGLFIFDMNTFHGLLDQWHRTSATHERGYTYVVETSFDPKRALGCCQITGFIKHDKYYRRFQEKHYERGYKPSEIEDLLKKAGLHFRKYDAGTLGRFQKRAGRLLYVCSLKNRKRI